MKHWYTNKLPFTSYTITAVPEGIFCLHDVAHSICLRIKSLLHGIEHTTVLWANHVCVMRDYKAGEGVPCISQLIN